MSKKIFFYFNVYARFEYRVVYVNIVKNYLEKHKILKFFTLRIPVFQVLDISNHRILENNSQMILVIRTKLKELLLLLLHNVHFVHCKVVLTIMDTVLKYIYNFNLFYHYFT